MQKNVTPKILIIIIHLAKHSVTYALFSLCNYKFLIDTYKVSKRYLHSQAEREAELDLIYKLSCCLYLLNSPASSSWRIKPRGTPSSLHILWILPNLPNFYHSQDLITLYSWGFFLLTLSTENHLSIWRVSSSHMKTAVSESDKLGYSN